MRRHRLPEGRTIPAQRVVQVPRRLQPPQPARRGRTGEGDSRVLIGQPRRRGGACSLAAGHRRRGRGAGDRLARQAGRDRGLRRRDPALRPGHRAPGGGGRRPGPGAVADADPAVRRLRRHGRPGQRWGGTGRAGRRARPGAGAGRRGRPGRGRRDRGQGNAPGRGDDRRRACRGRRHQPVAARGPPGQPGRGGHDRRRPAGPDAGRAHVPDQPAAARRRRDRARRGDRRGHAVLLRQAQGGRRAERGGPAGRPALRRRAGERPAGRRRPVRRQHRPRRLRLPAGGRAASWAGRWPRPGCAPRAPPRTASPR